MNSNYDKWKLKAPHPPQLCRNRNPQPPELPICAYDYSVKEA